MAFLLICLGSVFDVKNLEERLFELENEASNPDLWNDNLKAQKVLKEKSAIKNRLESFYEIANSYNDLKDFYQLAKLENDENALKEVANQILILQEKSDNLEIEALFSSEFDGNNCFVDINAGAGGTDSCDFAMMLLRMYERFSSNHNFNCEIVDFIDGDEAGVRSCAVKISGKNAFGWLKSEIGVHRLVRISPFNASGKRQTSFASVWVYPEIDDEIEIEILEKDLRIDTYRASGAGGQHVNKTDSAVRITHLPTNIVVQCQSSRSQIKNRAEAMKMLKSRLFEAELAKKKNAQEKQEESKTDNSWGHQIRSYVLHPYRLVKDLRSGYEENNADKVLNGEIENFIKSVLVMK